MPPVVTPKFALSNMARNLDAILSCRDTAALEALVADLCRGLVGARIAFIGQGDEIGQKLGAVMQRELPNSPQVRESLEGEVRVAAERGKHAVIYNSKERLPALLAAAPLDNLLLAMIGLDDAPIGVICLANKTGGFTEADAQTAADCAELAATALANLKAAELTGIFQVLSESSPIGIYVVQDGQFAFVNPQFQRLTGYTTCELLGKDPLSIVAVADRELVRQHAVNMLKGKLSEPYEYRIVTKDGEPRWIMETVGSCEFGGKQAAVGNFIDITERKSLEEQMGHLATHDPLTGLANRRLLQQAMDLAVSRAGRGQGSSLLFLDVDDFKLVNDTLGHVAGDNILVRVVQVLHRSLRDIDVLARIGGDEFAVLIDGAGAQEALVVAERLCAAVSDSNWLVDDVAFRLGLSIGIAAIDGTEEATAVIGHADVAMYQAKQKGGSRVVVFGDDVNSERAARGT